MTSPVRLGSRASPLALKQTEKVRTLLGSAAQVTITPMTTTGDRTPGSLADVGGKGLFAKEVDQAVLEGQVDCAVHSLKDMETTLHEGLKLTAVLARDDARDAMIGGTLSGLPDGARVGTSSVRRTAQIRARRPDLTVVPIRGNIGTRTAKLAKGDVDALILAYAGLLRVGKTDLVSEAFEPLDFLPAVGQGVIALVVRADDEVTASRLAVCHHHATHLAVLAERAMLAVLDGSCHTPIAGHATLEGHTLHLDGMVLAPDGSKVLRLAESTRLPDDPLEQCPAAEALGQTLGHRLARDGADILAAS